MTNRFDYSRHRPTAEPLPVMEPARPRRGRRTPRPVGADRTGTTVRWLVAALVVAVAAVTVALIALATTDTPDGRIGAMVLGWVLAGPVAIGLLAVHARADAAEQAARIVGPTAGARALYWVVLAVAVVGIGIGAWSIAEWAGRTW